MTQPTAPPSYAVAVEEKTLQPQPSAYAGQSYSTQYGAASTAAPYPATVYAPYSTGPPQPQPAYGSRAQVGFQPGSDAVYAPAPEHPADMGGEGGGFSSRGSFSDKNVRRMFIRKVFIILGIQLLVTFGIVCIFSLVPQVSVWVKANPGMYWASYGVFLFLYIILVCVESVRRRHPHNLVMLGLFTLALSYMTGTIAAFYDTEIVMICLGVTVFVCLTVIVFSMQTRFDFTKCSGVLFVLVMVLFMFGFLSIFWHGSQWYQIAYGCLGALIFTLFLAFDTQLVMGGRKHELDPEEYVYGALTLYIDVVYIFLFLLSIFGGSNN